MNRRHAMPALALLAASTLVLPGCLVTSSNATSYSGNHIEPGADRSVVLGQTTTAGAVQILGEPTSRTDVEVINGTTYETLTWRWSKRTQSSGSVFLIFGGSSDTTRESALHIEFVDGVASKKRRD